MTAETPKSTRILITGVAGFVGKHLVSHLKELGYSDIWGIGRSTSSLEAPKGIRYQKVDLLDAGQTRDMVGVIRPEQIYHLAGQASVASSWKNPEDTYRSNIQGQVNLFESLREYKLIPKILIACSSDEYGAVEPSELPVREENTLRPLSPYAISKVAQDLMGYQYYRSYGLPVIRARTFNHTGPGRPETYAISGFANQVARIELGLQPPVLHVGNLSVQRDYIDVRDVVRAYALGIKRGDPGEAYNICSGRAHSLQEVVDWLIKRSSTPIRVVQDPARMRPIEFPVIYGDPAKFSNATGWSPKINLERTVSDLLDYWRAKVKDPVSSS